VTPAGSVVVDAGSVSTAERSTGPNALRTAVEPHLGGCSKLIVGHGGLSKRLWGQLAAEVRGVTSGRELVSPLLVTTPGLVDRIRGWFGW